MCYAVPDQYQRVGGRSCVASQISLRSSMCQVLVSVTDGRGTSQPASVCVCVCMCVCVCVCVQYFPLESIQLFMTTTIREHIKWHSNHYYYENYSFIRSTL